MTKKKKVSKHTVHTSFDPTRPQKAFGFSILKEMSVRAPRHTSEGYDNI